MWRQRSLTRRGRRPGVAGLVAAALLVVASGCGDDGSDGGDVGTAGDGDEAPEGMVHVHGLGVDPADGRLYVATHFGMWRMVDDGDAARVGPVQDIMGFTVAEEGSFLASGHPGAEGLRAGDAPNLGLLESTDGGATWEELSLGGEADFHALTYAHDRTYGWSSTTGELMVSEDGIDWDTRWTGDLHDLAVDPDDGDRLVMSGPDGLAVSEDRGESWEPLDDAPDAVFLSWDIDEGLWGVDLDGGLHRTDGPEAEWEVVSDLPGPPQALLVEGGALYAAAADGVTGVYRSDDGGESWETLITDDL